MSKAAFKGREHNLEYCYSLEKSMVNPCGDGMVIYEANKMVDMVVDLVLKDKWTVTVPFVFLFMRERLRVLFETLGVVSCMW